MALCVYAPQLIRIHSRTKHSYSHVHIGMTALLLSDMHAYSDATDVSEGNPSTRIRGGRAMKRCITAIIMVCVGVVCTFGALAAEGTPEAGAGGELVSPDAQAFWTYITETNPYTQWKHWPGYEGIYPGKHPHGAYLKLYANEIALNAAQSGTIETLLSGAILVKENYGEDKKTLMAITPMYKFKGYNPGGGDWFWAKYGPDGTAMESGKVDSCIKCHSAAKTDYIFSEPK